MSFPLCVILRWDKGTENRDRLRSTQRSSRQGFFYGPERKFKLFPASFHSPASFI